MFLLIIFGIIVGFISAFFGVGGGMVLVPLLLFSGFSMKESVNISIVQMVFSSSYGTFLNFSKYKNDLKLALFVGFGGWIGGYLSKYIILNFSNQSLQYLFLLIVLFAIYKIFITPANNKKQTIYPSKILLFLIGLFIGFIAMSIGVGGAVMLTPILVSFFNFSLKQTSAISLFFVFFSSTAGLISHYNQPNMLLDKGIIVGISTFFGVYLGIKAKEIIKLTSYKTAFLIMYSLIFLSVFYKSI